MRLPVFAAASMLASLLGSTPAPAADAGVRDGGVVNAANPDGGGQDEKTTAGGFANSLLHNDGLPDHESKQLEDEELDRWREAYETLIKDTLATSVACKPDQPTYAACICKRFAKAKFPALPRKRGAISGYGVKYPMNPKVMLTFAIRQDGSVKQCRAEPRP